MKTNILTNIAAALSALLCLSACSSDTDAGAQGTAKINVEVSCHSRALDAAATLLSSDVKVNNAIVLFFDYKGDIEKVGEITATNSSFATTVVEGHKRMVVIANPSKEMRDLIVKTTIEQVPDGNGGLANVEVLTCTMDKYELLYPRLGLTSSMLKSVQTSKSVCQIYDELIELVPPGEDGTTLSLDVEVKNPCARIDLFARCPSYTGDAESTANLALKNIVLRACRVPASLPWELTIPSDESNVEAETLDVADRLIKVEDVFKDWNTVKFDANAPLGSLYTYSSTKRAYLEVGLQFEGNADYEWHTVDFNECMGGTFNGFEAGHLYQVFITFYPDKFGHIYVNTWVDSDLTFTIG
jgi:hypothetical protein